MTEQSDKLAHAASILRAVAQQFKIAADAIVTVQREGGQPVRIRLDELLRRMERRLEK